LECGFSKMSVEGHHLRALNSLKIKPNAKRTQASHKLCRVSLLLKINIKYMRQDTLFIGMGGLVGKKGMGCLVLREGAA